MYNKSINVACGWTQHLMLCFKLPIIEVLCLKSIGIRELNIDYALRSWSRYSKKHWGQNLYWTLMNVVIL